jgi:hypothetical protein
MTRATRTSWKTLPIPAQRESLEFAANFNTAEAELLVMGLIPQGMEDKWFVYFEGPAYRRPAAGVPGAGPPARLAAVSQELDRGLHLRIATGRLARRSASRRFLGES